MTNQDRGGKRPSIGSVFMVFLLRIFGGFSGLFHGKKTHSNMNLEEQKFFSTMLDDMKQDQRGDR